MSIPAADFDGAWKETVEGFLQPLLELTLTTVARDIDWSPVFQFLDSELRALFPNTRSRRRVDKLIRVFFQDGRARWICLHLEIQSQASKDTPKRMFQCFYRIYDQYGMPLLSIALLSDPDPNHRPGPLDLRVAGSGCFFLYHTCKRADFTNAFLEASPNPVAKVILAHRIAQRTAKDPTARMHATVRWIRELFRQGFSRDQITILFRALEAMNPLPDELDVESRDKVRHVLQTRPCPSPPAPNGSPARRPLPRASARGSFRDVRRDAPRDNSPPSEMPFGTCLRSDSVPRPLPSGNASSRR